MVLNIFKNKLNNTVGLITVYDICTSGRLSDGPRRSSTGRLFSHTTDFEHNI